MKKFFEIAFIGVGLAFFGCSGDSTNASADDSGYFITDIGTYELKQDALLFTEGQCEVKNGKLVWSKNGPFHVIPAQYDESKGTLRLSFTEAVVQFGYMGNNFPVGEFRALNAAPGKIDGVVLEKNNVLKFVIFKKDNCFFDDYNYSLHDGAKRIDCNTAEENGTQIKFFPLEGVSSKYIFSAGKVSCTNEIKTRYPYNEQDCKDAYNDFLKDPSAAATFEFKNYKTQLIQDEECLKDLAVEVYKNKG